MEWRDDPNVIIENGFGVGKAEELEWIPECSHKKRRQKLVVDSKSPKNGLQNRYVQVESHTKQSIFPCWCQKKVDGY